MAKIKLGECPKSFKKTVKFQLLDGTEGAIECIYKYRTRREFGDFIDSIVSGAKVKAPEEADGVDTFSMAQLMEKTGGANADYILKVLDGWNLDAELTRANVEQLADEMPLAVNTIMETYRVAIVEGRLGN